MKKLFALSVVAVLAASCSSHTGYADLRPGEVQLAGHPYKTQKDCDRKAPIGKFDGKCDVPVVGFSGFSMDNFGIVAGGGGASPGPF